MGGYNYVYEDLRKKRDMVAALPIYSKEIEEKSEKFIRIWDTIFAEEPLYYCHFDLHEYNILKGKNGYVAIDPIGMAAPFEFELVRFAINDVREHQKFGLRERIELLINYFARWVSDRKKLYAAMYIFMSYLTYNGAFEDKDIRLTEINLLVVDVLENIIDKDFF